MDRVSSCVALELYSLALVQLYSIASTSPLFCEGILDCEQVFEALKSGSSIREAVKSLDGLLTGLGGPACSGDCAGTVYSWEGLLKVSEHLMNVCKACYWRVNVSWFPTPDRLCGRDQ